MKNVAALLLIAPAALAFDSARLPDLQSVIESERSFARAAIDHGIRDSFLQFFADDSIIFAPAPTNGKAFYAKYDDKGRQLIWQPIFAAISNSGELGVTTGPWHLQKSKAEETPIAFGQFVSIWKKQPDNSWKVIVDVGVDHPQPKEPPPEGQFSLPNAAPSSESELAKKEEIFANGLKKDSGAAVLDLAGNGIRVFRDDSFPLVGKDAAKSMLASDQGEVSRKTSGSGISASGDLAYRYGSYSRAAGKTVEPGYYLTIWQTDRSGDWKIILDLQKKAPK